MCRNVRIQNKVACRGRKATLQLINPAPPPGDKAASCQAHRERERERVYQVLLYFQPAQTHGKRARLGRCEGLNHGYSEYGLPRRREAQTRENLI